MKANIYVIYFLLIFTSACLPKKDVKETSTEVSSASALTVTPKNTIVTVNDSIQINASGTPPYTYEL
ncbi:MAG: hypothetical protein KBD76_02635, partial [Bacteriovorax sp.]|nr:hypothetical protein [Bacteriovorax sp.]